MHLANGVRKFPKYSFKWGFGSSLQVDDMLGTGDDVFELKLKELDKHVVFGSMKRQKFDHCGEAVRETCQWRNYDFQEGIHP